MESTDDWHCGRTEMVSKPKSNLINYSGTRTIFDCFRKLARLKSADYFNCYLRISNCVAQNIECAWCENNLVVMSSFEFRRFQIVWAMYVSEGCLCVQSVMPGFVATKLSKIRHATIGIPTPESYARSALATVGLEARTFGCWAHALQVTLSPLSSCVVVISLLEARLNVNEPVVSVI